MHPRRFRISGVTVLAATVLVLLPALAWLQYSWLDQIAAADRERRERTLQTAASQLAADLDGELGRAFIGLQIDAATVDSQTWDAYAHRYNTWSAAAVDPGVVDHVYLVEFPAGTPGPSTTPSTPVLRRWQASSSSFDAVEWPGDLDALRERVRQQPLHFDLQGGRRGDRIPSPPLPMGDERTLVGPIMRVNVGTPGEGHPSPADVRLIGLTAIRLNLDVVRHEVLPALVRRHFFDADGVSEYRVAVVQREHPDQVIYESEPGVAPAVVAQPDASTTLLSARLRPMIFMARAGSEPRPARPGDAPSADNVVINVVETRRERGRTMQTRLLGPMEGHWRLVAKHRAGSLEAAVAGARARNVGLSSGILVLLATAIGLIVVSARRADRLAQRQMEFVAAVSHELRTPVAVIGAAAGNLADGVVGDPARVKRYGATIQGEARRLAETVERVLQLAGIAAGRAAAAPVAIAPARIVTDAIDACRVELEAAGFEVEIDVAADLPFVSGDVAALKSAVQNLVANAVKYARDGRWIRVSARKGSASSGRAGMGRTFVEIAVDDRGPGIAPADRPHIFEPFYRGRDAVAQQIPGSGLGLNLVKRIAEAHGGEVIVASEPGRGTRFTLRLPESREPVARGSESRIDEMAPLHSPPSA